MMEAMAACACRGCCGANTALWGKKYKNGGATAVLPTIPETKRVVADIQTLFSVSINSRSEEARARAKKDMLKGGLKYVQVRRGGEEWRGEDLCFHE